MIEHRIYRFGDEEHILELYRRVFDKELTTEVWQWKYNGLYPDKKLIFLAFENSICIGHYALMPYRINAFGKEVKSYISLDSMIHPKFQGQKVFSQLVQYAHNEISSSNEPYITFLNEKSITIYTKKYNWKYLGNIPVFCRPLSLNHLKIKNKKFYLFLKPFALIINQIFRKRGNILVKEFNLFTKEIELLFNDSRCYSMDRSIEFLDWRFNKSPFNYKKYKIYYDHKLIGYYVIRNKKKFNINFTWIMDLLIIRGYEDNFSNVLNAIALQNLYASDFITSMLPMKQYAKYYKRSGFIKIPSFVFPHDFYFCINKNKYNDDSIYSLGNWYMSWSLNDTL